MLVHKGRERQGERTTYPTVIMSIRQLANLVAMIPAMSSEMTWNERPAQSRSAALNVLNPMPVMTATEVDERVAGEEGEGAYWFR